MDATPADACLDQARLQLAQEGGVLGERLGELGRDAAARGGLLGEVVEAFGAAFEELVRFRHRFVGGSSPVVTRQIRDAAARAPIEATAPRPA